MKIIERLRLETITSHFHECNFSKNQSIVTIDFVEKKLEFEGCLITKCGYPNDEIYFAYDYYTQGDMTKYCLYEIENSNWIEELKNMNKMHSRHRDDLFQNDRHFIILFQDEVFECIANAFKISS